MRWIIPLCFILCLSVGLGHAAVTVGSVTNAGGSGDFGDRTFQHTVASDVNFLLFCAAMSTSTTVETLQSVTFAGQPMIKFVEQQQNLGAGSRVEMWYRLSPTIGTHDVVVDATDDPWYIYSAINLRGVAQVAPNQTAMNLGESANPSITIASAADRLVIDCLALDNVSAIPATPGSGQTQIVQSWHDAVALLVSRQNGVTPSLDADWTLTIGESVTYPFAYGAVSFSPQATQAVVRRGRPWVFD